MERDAEFRGSPWDEPVEPTKHYDQQKRIASARMAKQCADAINFYTRAGERGDLATISLVLPKGWKPPPKFPRRTLLCVNSRGERVYSLSAMNVLAWLAANGLVDVVVGVAETQSSNLEG